MTALTEVRQPWHDEQLGLDQDAYMKHALAQEAAGKRLVVQTYVNAYQDYEGDWWLEYVLLTDYRSGEQVLGYDPYEDAPAFDFDSICVVHNEIKWLFTIDGVGPVGASVAG